MLSSQEKIQLIEEKVINSYRINEDLENQSRFDKSCESVISTEGISFSEIPILVKKILIDSGLIITVAKRKENFELYLKEEFTEITERKEIDLEITLLSNRFDLSDKIIQQILFKFYKDNEWNIPKKNILKGFKLQIVECFQNNPDITQKELRECIRPHVKNDRCAEDYSREYHEFAKQLVNINR